MQARSKEALRRTDGLSGSREGERGQAPWTHPDKVCASRPSGRGCAGVVVLRGRFGRQSCAVEQNTGLQFRRHSLEISSLNQVVTTDIQLILPICAIKPVMFFSCDGDYMFVRHKEM